jgi:lysophospholipase L1-like esterase
MHNRFLFIAGVIACTLGLSYPASCQLVQKFSPPSANCCLLFEAEHFTKELEDWNQLGRYHVDDLRLEAEPAQPGRVVFMGDSITDFWNLAQFFPGKPYVNRGISGQTTGQMLVRMVPDVIDLHPAAMIVLAGTNDIAQNTGPETAKMVEENLEAMTELAEFHHIKVILCSLTPVSDYTKYRQTTNRPPADILALNRWIRAYVRRAHATFADYYSAVVDSHGMFRNGYSKDGLHPNDRGYALLVPVAEAAIEKALK